MDENRWFPYFLPDGVHYAYLSIDRARSRSPSIRVASLDSTEVKTLLPWRTSAVYAEPGYLLFRRETALVAQRFDADRLELEGQPAVVADEVGASAFNNQGFFSASENGVLAYLESGPGWQLTWFDRFGRPAGTAGLPGRYNSLCLTPDGKRAIYDTEDPASGNIDIWSLNLASGVTSRLTFDPDTDFYPVCSPSGDEVIFSSLRGGLPDPYRESLSAPGSERRLPQSPGPKIPTDWSRDNQLLVYSAFDPRTSWDVWVMPLSGGKAPFAIAATEAQEKNARLSPNGRWMAYTYQQSDVSEVFVQPFPAAGAKWQISRGGGQQPVWKGDGSELYYVSPDKKIMAVEVTTAAPDFAVGEPRAVVHARVTNLQRTNHGGAFAVTPDGERFLVSNAGDAVTPITLVLNWTSVLSR